MKTVPYVLLFLLFCVREQSCQNIPHSNTLLYLSHSLIHCLIYVTEAIGLVTYTCKFTEFEPAPNLLHPSPCNIPVANLDSKNKNSGVNNIVSSGSLVHACRIFEDVLQGDMI